MRFRERDELLHRFRGHARIDDEHVGIRDHRRDRDHVLGLVRQALVERVIDRVGTDVAHQDRVAVGRRGEESLNADDARGARAVVDDDRLAELGAHLVGKKARRDVGRAAGRSRNDDAYGFARKGLGAVRRGAGDGNDGERCGDTSFHQDTPAAATKSPMTHSRPTAHARERAVGWSRM
jgi:hypothetical protein